MRNIEGLALALLFAAGAAGAQAQAPTPVKGFAVDRLSPAAAGSGWVTLDDLAFAGDAGGAAALTVGYALRPLQVTAGGAALDLVRHHASAMFGLSFHWERLRLDAQFRTPLYAAGQGGVLTSGQGSWSYTAPTVGLEQNPDTLGDLGLGFTALLYGAPGGPLRLGYAARLFLPAGDPADYVTDDTYRSTHQLLFAGDAGRVSWAGQAGLHVRAADGQGAPGTPRGSELQFALGAQLHTEALGGTLRVGPELSCATALRSLFDTEATAVEGLLGAGLELGGGTEPLLRLRAAVGAGVGPSFGGAAFRAVLGVELGGTLAPAQPGSQPEAR